jgi:hypothetical protein
MLDKDKLILVFYIKTDGIDDEDVTKMFNDIKNQFDESVTVICMSSNENKVVALNPQFIQMMK